MKYPAYSELYTTTYLSWPDQISRRCDICDKVVHFAHADNGKMIYMLNEQIQQVVNYYTCENPKCENYHKYFNPAPRFDFSRKYIGTDVIDRINRELFVFDQSPVQIHKRLTLDYAMEISLQSIEQYCKEILLVKAKKIDEKTKLIINQTDGIILAMDAQDPGAGQQAIWLFTEARFNRVLRTVLVDSMPHEKLHTIIEEILHDYQTKLLGAVHDKQNNIVKCMNTFYKGIPDQYCTYHLTDHLWAHLAMLDNQIYSIMKGVIMDLYIHTAVTQQLVYFEDLGNFSVTEVFKAMDDDLQKMTHYRTKKFQFLRGIALFRTVKRYVLEMKGYKGQMAGQLRFDKIYQKVIDDLDAALSTVQTSFSEALFLYDQFKIIYRIIYHESLLRADRQRQLDEIFGVLWAVVRMKEPSLQLEQLRSFNAKAGSTFAQILGEWVRLWNSYLPGLFAYYDFPQEIKTNTNMERIFSQEKVALIRRMAKKEVGFMQELQGDLYIRLSCCDQAELLHDIVQEYMTTEVDVLKATYQEKVHQITTSWFYRSEKLEGIEKTLQKYHPNWKSKKRA